MLLDAEHGVNPSLEQCFVCMEDVGVVLLGAQGAKVRQAMEGGDGSNREAPRRICMNQEPCAACVKHMEMGVILISVDEAKSGKDLQNPYRTGGWCVVTDDFITRIIPGEELRGAILSKRMAFLPDEAWDLIGLPRGAT